MQRTGIRRVRPKPGHSTRFQAAIHLQVVTYRVLCRPTARAMRVLPDRLACLLHLSAYRNGTVAALVLHSRKVVTMFDILVVDDEIEILHALKRELRIWARERNLRILTATTGEEALEMITADSDRIAILLTDNRMPGLSGAELIRRVIASRFAVVPVLITGYTGKQNIQAALSTGAFDVIVKPWNRADLQQQLDHALQTYDIRRRTLKNGSPGAGSRMTTEFRKRYLEANVPRACKRLEVSYVQRPDSVTGTCEDYLDFFELGNDQVLVFLGTASGESMPAAFLSAIVKSMIHSEYMPNCIGARVCPADLLDWLNERIFAIRESVSNLFMSLLVCLLDTRTGRVTYSAAGAPTPIHARGRAVEQKVGDGLALGANPRATYRETVLQVTPGDSLYLLSNGMMRRNQDAGESEQVFDRMLGESRYLVQRERSANARNTQSDGTAVRVVLSPSTRAGRPPEPQTISRRATRKPAPVRA